MKVTARTSATRIAFRLPVETFETSSLLKCRSGPEESGFAGGAYIARGAMCAVQNSPGSAAPAEAVPPSGVA